MLNILLVSFWSFPNTGAIDIYIKALTNTLRADGHKVDLFCRGAEWNDLGLFGTGADIDIAEYGSLAESSLETYLGKQFSDSPHAVRKGIRDQYLFEIALARLCKWGKYDVIHAQDVLASRAVARVKPPGIPLVVTSHGLLAYEVLAEKAIPSDLTTPWRYYYLAEKLGAESADVSIVPCEWMRNEYVDYFRVSSEKVVVLHCGIDDISLIRRSREPLKNTPSLFGKTVITCVARLVPLKGHDILLRALVHVRERFPDIVCLLVGNGHIERLVRQRVKELGLDDIVSFLGRRDDVPEILGNTDVVVLSSLQEVTPLTIMEAQLLGKPVVASNICGIPDLIENEKTGLLVPPANDVALANAISRLIADPALRSSLGKAARVSAYQKFTWRKHYKALLGVYSLAKERIARDN